MIICCFIKNKLIYQIELQMSTRRFLHQIKENKLFYYNKDKRCFEIINLNLFDRVTIDGLELLNFKQEDIS